MLIIHCPSHLLFRTRLYHQNQHNRRSHNHSINTYGNSFSLLFFSTFELKVDTICFAAAHVLLIPVLVAVLLSQCHKTRR